MLFTPEELKQQSRELWKTCFHDSDEFLDIYFEEKYRHDRNVALRRDGAVVAAAHLLPYRMTFYGSVLHAGYVSGLCVHPAHRGRGLAREILHRCHRDLYRRGGAVSFLIPGSEDLRHFYEEERHSAYWTATYRGEVAHSAPASAAAGVQVERPDEWADELYVYYRRHAAVVGGFMLHPSADDFFAALALCDLENGYVLTARRGRRIAGLCLAAREADGRLFVSSWRFDDEAVRDSFVGYLCRAEGVSEVFVRPPVPGTADGARPYAMARVVNVDRFLRAVLRAHPDFELRIGVGGDADIPENNGYYVLADGRLSLTDERPEQVVTPGGLAALLLGALPFGVEMMLD